MSVVADTRGSKQNSKSQHKKQKRKKDKAVKTDDNERTTDLSDLMTKEDESLIHNLEDEDEVIDFNDFDGKDIDPSEISQFIKELDITKYASILVEKDEEADPDSNKTKKQKTAVKNGEDVEIKEEPIEKATKKKKKKPTVEDAEIKEEPKNHSKESSEMKKKNGKANKKMENKILAKNNSTIDEVKEEKPDLKAIQAAMSYMKMSKGRSQLLLKPGETWREEKVYPVSKLGPENKVVKEAMQVAERLLEEDTARYTKQRESTKKSDSRWLKTVIASGTLSDKIAALTLLVQESPVHNLASIDSLVAMATKKCRREAGMAIDTLKDLFVTGLLPEDHKLKYFHQFPVHNLWDMTSGNVDQRDKLLLFWYLEDMLKKKYSQFIKVLGDLSFDNVKATKEKAVKLIHELLSSRPEQEHVLLPMLVNKMGDQTIKNKATIHMLKLIEEHPNMKGVIVREICQLLYRPNVSPRAQYCAICFLTQVRLSKEESKLANELIKIYLSFFQINLKKRLVDTKTMSALLTGVNRAYVYASDEKSDILGQVNEVYKILPTVNFQTSVQGLMLLYHITNDKSPESNRFYTVLYRKLNDPGLATTTKHAVFLNLLFKSLKRDPFDNRVVAFIRRILQVYTHHPAQVICGILILLSQIVSSKPSLLNLHSKAKIEEEETKPEEISEDEEENYTDLPIPEEFRNKDQSMEVVENGEEKPDPTSSAMKGSWMHRQNKTTEAVKHVRDSYDPHHRNPLFARAELDCMWELKELTQHFHPTVSLYATTLLKGESIDYNGDPLADYTMIRFLDRFVYKNPKKVTTQMGAGAPLVKETPSLRAIPVNSQKFLSQDVPEDEKFYMKYFSEKEKNRKEKEDDEDSVGDDEFDKYMEKHVDGRLEDFGQLEMDFARDKAKSKTNVKKDDENSESEDDDDFDDDDDEDMGTFDDLKDDELAAEFEKELQGLNAGSDDEGLSMSLGNDEDGFNEEDVDFSDDENNPLGAMMKKPVSGKRKLENEIAFGSLGKEPKKKKKSGSTDLFASAEEFSHMLEEDIESGTVSLGGANQMRNQDKASLKQLAWEEKRDKWFHDKDKPFKKKGKGKPFGNKSGKPKPNFKRK